MITISHPQGTRWVNITKIEATEILQDFDFRYIETYRDIIPAYAGEIAVGTMIVTQNEYNKLVDPATSPRVLAVEEAFIARAIPHDSLIHPPHAAAAFSYPDVYIEDRAVHLHGLDKLYAEGFDGEGYTIGVPDTGITQQIYEKHKDRIVGYKDFVGDIPGGWAKAARHGDWCGLAALPPAAKLVPIKVLGDDGSGSGAHVAQGMNYAVEQGCDAICISIGGGTRQIGMYQLAAAKGMDRGQPMFVASGNAGCGTGNNIEAPANSPDCFACAAVDLNMAIAPFSCCGPETWMAHAGVQLMVQGIPQAMSGTSMTPWAPGQAFLLLKQALGIKPGPMTRARAREILTGYERAALDQPGVLPRNEGHGVGKADGALLILKPEEKPIEPVPVPPAPTPVDPVPLPPPTPDPEPIDPAPSPPTPEPPAPPADPPSPTNLVIRVFGSGPYAIDISVHHEREANPFEADTAGILDPEDPLEISVPVCTPEEGGSSVKFQVVLEDGGPITAHTIYPGRRGSISGNLKPGTALQSNWTNKPISQPKPPKKTLRETLCEKYGVLCGKR